MCFNPLHCGAVVASENLSNFLEVLTMKFQSPSLRGSGRFHKSTIYPWLEAQSVSIPFIAGQWSLPVCWLLSFSSFFVSIPFIAGQWSLPNLPAIGLIKLRFRFNPLHCGAVVASNIRVARCRCIDTVSIPFIAGQWSLPDEYIYAGAVGLVSIPFIAGQWSLPERAQRLQNQLDAMFQSPSLRGSGRF